MKKTYIHYGSNYFDPQRFEPIKNETCFTKPIGGLWASDINATFGWHAWCKKERYQMDHLNQSFRFYLSDNANVFYIDSREKLKGLPRTDTSVPTICWLDFEAMVEQGIDAIEISLTDCPGLYWDLWGWDCDSILVMNKDVIVPIE